jgi:TolB protein
MRAVRELLMIFAMSASAVAQSGNLGMFTNSGDVGSPAKKGSTEFDVAKAQYRITGSGTNIWAKKDEFQYVGREISGNFTLTATVQFLDEGTEYRKAGIMLRQSLGADSPYVDLVIRESTVPGPGVQWRTNKGENSNKFDLPFDGPGIYKLKIVRSGLRIIASTAKEGAELKEAGRTDFMVPDPILIGLVVCSHNWDKSEAVVFSEVSVAR